MKTIAALCRRVFRSQSTSITLAVSPSLSGFFRHIGIREFTLDGAWGESATYSKLRPISELDKMVIDCSSRYQEALPLKIISHGGDLRWLFDAPESNGQLIVQRAYSAAGVVIPPGYHYGGMDYIFWRARYDGSEFLLGLTTMKHSDRNLIYLKLAAIRQELNIDRPSCGHVTTPVDGFHRAAQL